MSWDDFKEPVNKIATWFVKLPYINILLLFCLIAIILGPIYIVRYEVPVHLKLIQKGYTQLEEVHQEERKVQREAFSEKLDLITDSFKDSMDRQEAREAKRDSFLERMFDKLNYNNGNNKGQE